MSIVTVPTFRVRFLLLLYKTTLNFWDDLRGLRGRLIRVDIQYIS